MPHDPKDDPRDRMGGDPGCAIAIILFVALLIASALQAYGVWKP